MAEVLAKSSFKVIPQNAGYDWNFSRNLRQNLYICTRMVSSCSWNAIHGLRVSDTFVVCLY